MGASRCEGGWQGADQDDVQLDKQDKNRMAIKIPATSLTSTPDEKVKLDKF